VERSYCAGSTHAVAFPALRSRWDSIAAQRVCSTESQQRRGSPLCLCRTSRRRLSLNGPARRGVHHRGRGALYMMPRWQQAVCDYLADVR